MTRRAQVRKYAGNALAGLTLLLAAGLSGTVLMLWLEGAALRQADPSAEIFTPVAVGRRLRWLLPVLVLWLTAWLTAVFAGRGRRESVPGCAANRVKSGETTPERRVCWPWYGLLVLAAVLIVLGVLNGGLRDVLVKAANICTECVGLG